MEGKENELIVNWDSEEVFTEEPKKEEKVVEKKTETTPAEVKKPEEKVEEDEHNLLEGLGGAEEEEEQETLDLEKVENGSAILQLFKDQGYLEEEEEFENDVDIFNTGIEKVIEEKLLDLPETVRELNKFVLGGGDPETFINALVEARQRTNTKIDIDKEEGQKQFMSWSLKQKGYDDEYIETQIEFLIDSGKLENISKKEYEMAQNKSKTFEAEQRKELLKNQKEQKENAKRERLELKTKVTSILKDNEDLRGFKISEKEKRELPKYMVDNTVKLEDGSYITEMQRDLFSFMQKEENALLIAKLLKSDFDFTPLINSVESKVTNKVKDNIRRNQKPNKSSGGSNRRQKSLAEYFTK